MVNIVFYLDKTHALPGGCGVQGRWGGGREVADGGEEGGKSEMGRGGGRRAGSTMGLKYWGLLGTGVGISHTSCLSNIPLASLLMA